MKRYPAYKDSGIEWIGKLPDHWAISRMKNFIAYAINGIWGDEPMEDGTDILCIRVADFDMDNLGVSSDKLTYRHIPIRDNDQRILDKGDLLLEKSGGGEKTPVGRVISYDLSETAVSSNFIAKISPNTSITDSRFLLYSFSVLYSYGINNLSIKQTTGIQNLNSTHYFNNPFCFPSLDEQKQIATFLDLKTRQIDDLITKKQKLIELLKEERTALINQAVTKGLDPTVPMKDSEIEWLGEIPVHWHVNKIKRMSEIKGRIGFKGYTKEDLIRDGEGALTIGAKHIDKKNRIDLSDPEYIKWEKYLESPEIMVRKGDILVTQRGSLGKVALIEEEIGNATINPSMVILKKITINPKFFYYFLNGDYFRQKIDIIGTATAVPMISQDQLGNFLVLIPSPNEQFQIVAILDNKTKQIDDLIEREQRQINQIIEYKTSLINEAVTGKIDVRDYQISHA